MRHHRKGCHFASLGAVIAGLLLISALLAPLAPAVSAQSVVPPDGEEPIATVSSPAPPALLYRSQVRIAAPIDRQRLANLDVVVLNEGSDWALVLVDTEQLEALARLGFRPRGSDELATLVAAHAHAKPWLVNSLQPLLSLSAEAQSQIEAGSTAGPILGELRAAVHSLSAEQKAGLVGLTSLDDDGDGLTNTEEVWWCTDPANPNSDSDASGYLDGQEVQALLDFTLSRDVRWGYGPPFGPPAAWPDWNGADGDPQTPACNDGDYDTIPDFAEVYMVGSRVPEETTDLDKFDDGQELFGVTYCPGAPTSCGYGNYPRIEYWNFIKASMPSWVRPPGDNLFVAAFPILEVTVVPGSWTVEKVTTITTQEGEITETTNTYQTSRTRGQSTLTTETTTWNDWEEVSRSIETETRASSGIQADEEDCWDQPLFKRILCLKTSSDILIAADAAYTAARALCDSSVDVEANVVVAGVGASVQICPLSAQLAQRAAALQYEEALTNVLGKDALQKLYGTHSYILDGPKGVEAAPAVVGFTPNIDTQGIINALDGIEYAINEQGQLLARSLHGITNVSHGPIRTDTRSRGRSRGGSRTTASEQYQEHTTIEGEAFTTGQNWSTAWANDSSHAADLTFNYVVENLGTEYAREIGGLIFGIYLGDDTDPIISYAAW